MSKKLFALLGLLVVASLMLGACQPAAPTTDEEPAAEEPAAEEPAAEEPAAEEGPVTLRGYDTSDIPSLDPQIAEDVTSINGIESLFVHLTNYDLNTAEIVPEAATAWTISEDGLTFTFTIRNDIPWVNHNPVTGETTQEVDADGNPLFVTANDFVYAIQRACSPDTGGYYSGVIGAVIAGCSAALYEEGDIAAVGVSAPDPATLVINLEFAASYFLSMTPMWTIAASPSWAIDEHGDNWTEAGNIVTNGRYVLHEWVHGVRRQFVRNPLMPADMYGSGNIEAIVVDVVPDVSTGYALWLAGEVETSGIPDAELQAHLENFPDETQQVADLAVFYISFDYNRPPFDDSRVRAAFSAAFDRETFINEVRQGQGLPMKHFAPPGIFGAPPIDEVGVGYDPVFAAEQLAAAGYPNCEGFPQVTLLGYSGEATLRWIEFAQANWSQNLGCSADLIQIEQQSFADLLAATEADAPNRPNMWTLGWGPDYGDENNWVGDVLLCDNPNNRQGRTCNEIDDMIRDAARESDPDTRIAMYAEIEEAFFGPEGEFPFAPIFLRIAFVATHGWYDITPALFGGNQVYNYTIDTAMRAEMTQ